MYEDKTFELILGAMVNRAEDWARQRGETIDTREGSIIYSALAPAAAELHLAYIDIKEILDETFEDTASREFLIRRAAEKGVFVYQATSSIRRGEFSMDVPIGARFSLNRLNYRVVEKESTGVFRLICEAPGIVGNLDSGAMVPVDFIAGLEFARLTGVLIPGEDEEATEHLRNRLEASRNSQSFGGNIQDYVDKTTSLPGVGGVKVYRGWDGGGTVKLIITDSTYHQPSATLIDDTQTAIDPIPHQGQGLGIATIGHTVTVSPVDVETINISFQLTYESGWSWPDLQPHALAVIDDYFNELSAEWDTVDWRNDSGSTLVIRISQIETRILTLAGVLDIQGTTINGGTQNIALDPDAIPVRGTVTDG